MILERMNRILHVDEDLAYAVIEPGVTYDSLNRYLKDHNIKLWADCTGGPPKGSVLGNALDRGVGVTTHGDHFASLCGLEVVLPDGRVVRTGGYPDGRDGTRYTYKWGIGPYLEGLFSQGNLGIVTHAGIWLMPEPESYLMFGFTMNDEKKFVPLLNVLRKLALDGVIPDKIRLTNGFAVLTILTQWINEQDVIKGRQYLTPEDLDRLEQKYGTGAWGFCSSVYGRKEHVVALRALITRELSTYGRLVFLDDRKVKRVEKLLPFLMRSYGKHRRIVNTFSDWALKVSLPMLQSLPPLYNVYQGVPTEFIVRRAYFRAKMPRPEKDVHVARDQVGLIWFGPLVPLDGQTVFDIMDLYRKKFTTYEFDCYVTVLMLNARTVVPLLGIMYRQEDAVERERAVALYQELYDDALASGYQQFRCSRLGWSSIFKGTPDILALNTKIKDAVDPNHVIAPGKFGIW